MIYLDQTYRVVLFGHRDFDGHRRLDERLYPLLKDLIRTKPFLEIYIGRNGEFDIYAATIVKRVQSAMGKDNNEFICVLPYPEKDIEYAVFHGALKTWKIVLLGCEDSLRNRLLR